MINHVNVELTLISYEARCYLYLPRSVRPATKSHSTLVDSSALHAWDNKQQFTKAPVSYSLSCLQHLGTLDPESSVLRLQDIHAHREYGLIILSTDHT